MKFAKKHGGFADMLTDVGPVRQWGTENDDDIKLSVSTIEKWSGDGTMWIAHDAPTAAMVATKTSWFQSSSTKAKTENIQDEELIPSVEKMNSAVVVDVAASGRKMWFVGAQGQVPSPETTDSDTDLETIKVVIVGDGAIGKVCCLGASGAEQCVCLACRAAC